MEIGPYWTEQKQGNETSFRAHSYSFTDLAINEGCSGSPLFARENK